jgi:hypothetical protein
METHWYAAHLVMYLRCTDGQQDYYPVWENVVLIEAETADEAVEKAKLRAQDDEGDPEGNLTCNDKPAEWVFAGIRKIVPCVNSTEQPGDGTEITFAEFTFEDTHELERFIAGEEVTVTLSASSEDE